MKANKEFLRLAEGVKQQFGLIQLTDRDIELAVRQCEHQNATSVRQIEGMVRALAAAKGVAFTRRRESFNPETVLELEYEFALLIEPAHAGYRKVPAQFADGSWAPDADLVPALMAEWSRLYAAGNVLPDDGYFLYEDAHPHADGNGRNGWLFWAIDMMWRTGLWPTEFPKEYHVIKRERLARMFTSGDNDG